MPKPHTVYHFFVFINPNDLEAKMELYEDTDIEAKNLLNSKKVKKLIKKGYTQYRRMFSTLTEGNGMLSGLDLKPTGKWAGYSWNDNKPTE
jgi:hypothetical protein